MGITQSAIVATFKEIPEPLVLLAAEAPALPAPEGDVETV
jgi:hypothetical protein